MSALPSEIQTIRLSLRFIPKLRITYEIYNIVTSLYKSLQVNLYFYFILKQTESSPSCSNSIWIPFSILSGIFSIVCLVYSLYKLNLFIKHKGFSFKSVPQTCLLSEIVASLRKSFFEAILNNSSPYFDYRSLELWHFRTDNHNYGNRDATFSWSLNRTASD